jgi:hypothetical protein
LFDFRKSEVFGKKRKSIRERGVFHDQR